MIAYSSKVTDLVIDLALSTRRSHVWWDEQVRLLIGSGLFTEWDEVECVARVCARNDVPPGAVVALLNGWEVPA